MVKVSLYGRLADLLGPELEVDAPPDCSVGEIRRRLTIEHPRTAEALSNGRVRACIGDSLVGDARLIGPGESVEFLPPVSGG